MDHRVHVYLRIVMSTLVPSNMDFISDLQATLQTQGLATYVWRNNSIMI